MQKVALVNSTTDTLKNIPKLRDNPDRAWFIRLLRHPARKRSGSVPTRMITMYVRHCSVDHLRNLDTYEVVVPRRVDRESSSSTWVVGRQKRSSGNDDDDEGDGSPSYAVYELSAFGRRMSLRLRLSPTSLVSPSYVVQHVADNATWLASPAASDGSSPADRWRNCFHEGHVDGDPQSVVVLSTCPQLVSDVIPVSDSDAVPSFVHVSVCVCVRARACVQNKWEAKAADQSWSWVGSIHGLGWVGLGGDLTA